MREQTVIELGSNSCKVLVADLHDSCIVPLQDIRIPLRLASELDENNHLSTIAIERILHTLKTIQSDHTSSSATYLVGTEALRLAKNKDQIQKTIKLETMLDLRILEPEEEAKAFYLGMLSGLEITKKAIAFDTGGSSTEIILGNGSIIEQATSIPLGAVVLTKKYIAKYPISNCDFFSVDKEIAKLLRFKKGGRDTVIGGGGVVVCSALVQAGSSEFNGDALNGQTIPKSEITRQISMFRSMTVEQIRSIPGMDPHRADIILPGLMIVRRILDTLGCQKLIVSTRGVRHGILVWENSQK